MESNFSTITLKLELNHDSVELFNFNCYLVTIGRSKDRDIQIQHPSISRRHACVYLSSEGKFIIKDGDLLDIRSKYGVYVNGKRIDIEKELNFRDQITFFPMSEYPKITNITNYELDEETTAIHDNQNI